MARVVTRRGALVVYKKSIAEQLHGKFLSRGVGDASLDLDHVRDTIRETIGSWYSSELCTR